MKHFKPHLSHRHAECPLQKLEKCYSQIFDSHLRIKEVFPYGCMWKLCICNVSRPLYVSVCYLENASFWTMCLHSMALAIVWFLDMAWVKRKHQLVLTWGQCLSVWQDLCTLSGQEHCQQAPLTSQHTHTHAQTHTHYGRHMRRVCGQPTNISS